MELKRLITQFTYRIEPKPEGGFIAHATDPSVPPLEAATREELQRKIQAAIAAGLASEFPGLKLPLESQELKFNFHIEPQPGGGFAIQSADPNAKAIEGTRDEIESHFAEKLITFAGKHFAPELSQALSTQGGSGDIKVFVTRKAGISVKTGSHALSLDAAPGLLPVGLTRADDAKPDDGSLVDGKTTEAKLGSMGETISNSPITPERSSSWALFGVLALLMVVVAMYFFLYHN
jgi:hypothetical protein